MTCEYNGYDLCSQGCHGLARKKNRRVLQYAVLTSVIGVGVGLEESGDQMGNDRGRIHVLRLQRLEDISRGEGILEREKS